MQTPERLDLRTAGLLLRGKAPKKEEIYGKGAANILMSRTERMSQLSPCGMGTKELEEYIFGREIKLAFLIVSHLNSDLFKKKGEWIDVLQARVMGRLLFYLREGSPCSKRENLEEFGGFLLNASAGHLWRDEPEYAKDLAEIYLQVFSSQMETP